MEIRKAELKDLQDIIVLNVIDDYGNPDIFIQDSIKNWLVWVAIVDDTIVAFSLYQIIWWNTAFHALVKVHPDYQWQGIGTALTITTENKLKKEWFNSLTSSTEESNTLARKFHEKLNYMEIWILDLPHGKEVFYRKDL